MILSCSVRVSGNAGGHSYIMLVLPAVKGRVLVIVGACAKGGGSRGVESVRILSRRACP